MNKEEAFDKWTPYEEHERDYEMEKYVWDAAWDMQQKRIDSMIHQIDLLLPKKGSEEITTLQTLVREVIGR